MNLNEQHSRIECLEISGIPISIDNDNLEPTFLSIFEKIGLPVLAENIEAVHRLKLKYDNRKVMVKLSCRKDVYQNI